MRVLTESTDFSHQSACPARYYAARGAAWANADAPDAAEYPRMPLLAQLGPGLAVRLPGRDRQRSRGGAGVLQPRAAGPGRIDAAPDGAGRHPARTCDRAPPRRRTGWCTTRCTTRSPSSATANSSSTASSTFLARAPAPSRDDQFAVLFVDLDRFKAINDGLGHQAGDQLIVGHPRRLSACLRQTDLAARDARGGDRCRRAPGRRRIHRPARRRDQRRHARPGRRTPARRAGAAAS